jgi:deoxyribodipyrimidine photo-lyase
MRRDLRLEDNVALGVAAEHCARVTCAFVLDPVLLTSDRMGAPIVQFFFDSLRTVRAQLRELGSDLALLHGDFTEELLRLAKRTKATAVFYNEDYDPVMRTRDAGVTRELEAANVHVAALTDHVYVAANEIVQANGKFYSVYTPYRRRWEALVAESPRPPVPSLQRSRGRFASREEIGDTLPVPLPEAYGYVSSALYPKGGSIEARALLRAFAGSDRINGYHDTRNEPAIEGTSRLSPHLRAGTIGIRACMAIALRVRAETPNKTGANTWIGELTWRDFYQQLLVHAARVADEPFIPAAATIKYRDDERAWNAWAEGRTGYPIVDAAMVQLNTTGWMHNRLRMIVASFLTKHLLIDYHRGERYFEQRLADADLAANNGGWQWSASTGVDAAPYFRVFNPTLQGKTYDPAGTFVRRMLPALANVPTKYIHEPWTMPPILAAEVGFTPGLDYPDPIVDHAVARARAIAVYGAALKT